MSTQPGSLQRAPYLKFFFSYIVRVKKRREILSQYSDVIVWLANVGSRDLIKLSEIKGEAVEETAKHFHIQPSEVDALVRHTQLQLPESDIPAIDFFYEHLRKIRDS